MYTLYVTVESFHDKVRMQANANINSSITFNSVKLRELGNLMHKFINKKSKE